MSLTVPEAEVVEKPKRGGPGRQAEPNPYEPIVAELKSTPDKALTYVLDRKDAKRHINAMRRAGKPNNVSVRINQEEGKVGKREVTKVTMWVGPVISRKPGTPNSAADAATKGADQTGNQGQS